MPLTCLTTPAPFSDGREVIVLLAVCRSGRTARSVVGALAAGFTAMSVSACSGHPAIQLETVATGGSVPTVTQTVTATTTATATVTATATMSVTVTVTATAAPTGTVLPSAPSIPSTFNEASARTTIGRLIADIGRLDVEFAKPAGVPATLVAFDDHLEQLLAAGVSPGTDGPSYVARIMSLRVFASAARTEAGSNRSRAVARYAVVRQETGVLLGQLNVALRAAYVLPPPPTPTTSGPTTSPTS